MIDRPRSTSNLSRRYAMLFDVRQIGIRIDEESDEHGPAIAVPNT